MTNVFNIFVYLQVFNMINCRKINDEKNIFEGIHTNWMFLAIWLVIAGMQVIIIEFFQIVFDVSPGGLPW
jgi:magnesium-transporting ATPase (P-type)